MSWKLKTQNGQVGKPENKTLLKKKKKRKRGKKMLNSENQCCQVGSISEENGT